MATEILNKYRIWSNTTSGWIYIWDETEPQTVDGHTIDISKTTIIDSLDSTVQEVLVQEEYEKTGAHYQATSIVVDIPASTGWVTKDLSFPHPISILSAEFTIDSENFLDIIEAEVAPNTIIGAITSGTSINDTVINVSQTVIDNLEIGYHVTLTNFVDTDICGRCTNIDPDNMQITVETPVTRVYSPITPTYILMTPKLIYNLVLGKAGRWTVGESKIGASYIPSNVIIRFKYNNLTTDAKKFIVNLEYLY